MRVSVRYRMHLLKELKKMRKILKSVGYTVGLSQNMTFCTVDISWHLRNAPCFCFFKLVSRKDN